MVTVGNGTSLIGWAEVFSVVTTLEKYLYMFFHYCYCNLLPSPLVPAIDSKITGKSKEAKNKEEPKDSIYKSMTFVKDIRNSVDAGAAGKVFRGLNKGILVLFLSHISKIVLSEWKKDRLE